MFFHLLPAVEAVVRRCECLVVPITDKKCLQQQILTMWLQLSVLLWKGIQYSSTITFFHFNFLPVPVVSPTNSVAREMLLWHISYWQVVTACSLLTTTLLKPPLSVSFTVTQKPYSITEIALPEGKTHRAGIWEIPLIRVERCWIKGQFKRHRMRVHEIWFYFLPLCDTGQCIPCPFYGRQRSVTIKSVSL